MKVTAEVLNKFRKEADIAGNRGDESPLASVLDEMAGPGGKIDLKGLIALTFVAPAQTKKDGKDIEDGKVLLANLKKVHPVAGKLVEARLAL